MAALYGGYEMLSLLMPRIVGCGRGRTHVAGWPELTAGVRIGSDDVLWLMRRRHAPARSVIVAPSFQAIEKRAEKTATHGWGRSLAGLLRFFFLCSRSTSCQRQAVVSGWPGYSSPCFVLYSDSCCLEKPHALVHMRSWCFWECVYSLQWRGGTFFYF